MKAFIVLTDTKYGDKSIELAYNQKQIKKITDDFLESVECKTLDEAANSDNYLTVFPLKIDLLNQIRAVITKPLVCCDENESYRTDGQMIDEIIQCFADAKTPLKLNHKRKCKQCKGLN